MDRRVHTAKELYDMGVVDVLAANGEGREAVLTPTQRQYCNSTRVARLPGSNRPCHACLV